MRLWNLWKKGKKRGEEWLVSLFSKCVAWIEKWEMKKGRRKRGLAYRWWLEALVYLRDLHRVLGSQSGEYDHPPKSIPPQTVIAKPSAPSILSNFFIYLWSFRWNVVRETPGGMKGKTMNKREEHTMMVTLVMRKKTALSIGTAIRMNKNGAIRTS